MDVELLYTSNHGCSTVRNCGLSRKTEGELSFVTLLAEELVSVLTAAEELASGQTEGGRTGFRSDSRR